jgi:hypothetical protein
VSPPSIAVEERPAEFGLQDNTQALQPGVARADASLCFSCEAIVKLHRQTGAPDFGGAFIQGPAGGRFLYLSWRAPGGAWIRRLKIPLAGVTWEQVAQAARSPAGVLLARVSGAGSGTVPLLDGGWVASEQAIARCTDSLTGRAWGGLGPPQ